MTSILPGISLASTCINDLHQSPYKNADIGVLLSAHVVGLAYDLRDPSLADYSLHGRHLQLRQGFRWSIFMLELRFSRTAGCQRLPLQLNERP